ncbi:hypothetical protein PN441_10375 [Spirulina major CS-329]|nr:hypothetical protein [Spirulina major]MDB9496870.1 hypothetical protein [Spirulina subsalsa CS-330]MDB9503474.1 hypothetical protein [Spirulina major CS-329]
MLLSHYGFDTKPHTTAERMGHWLDAYEADWIRTAIIEALYQGRYKAVSVEHILSLWQKRGRPSPHFTGDFERIICRKLPEWYMNISSVESDAAVNEPAAAELPVFTTTPSAPPVSLPPVAPGVQRWRQLAQIGPGTANGEGMIARLRSFAYLDVTAPPQVSPTAVDEISESLAMEPADLNEGAIANRPEDVDPSGEALDGEADRAIDCKAVNVDGNEWGTGLDHGQDSTAALDVEPEFTEPSDLELEDLELEDLEHGLTDESAIQGEADNPLEAELTLDLASDPEAAQDTESITESITAVDLATATEPEALTPSQVAPSSDGEGEDSDRATPPTANLLLLSQPQTVKPRPTLDLPNPKRNYPTFRSGIRTFVPTVELSPFLARLLYFYVTLPTPEAIDPAWASEPLPVSIKRS